MKTKALVLTLALALVLMASLAVNALGSRQASAANPWTITSAGCAIDGPHFGDINYYTASNGNTSKCWKYGTGPAR